MMPSIDPAHAPHEAITPFACAYPPPWRIHGDEIVDRDGNHVNAIEVENPVEVAFWTGIIGCVNAVHTVAADDWLAGAIVHVDEGGSIGEPAARDLLRRLEACREAIEPISPPFNFTPSSQKGE